MNDLPEHADGGTVRSPTRRAVLAKLGLAAGIAYVTPVVLSLSQARASGFSGASAPSGPGTPSSHSGSSSGPSRPSGGGSSGPSRPQSGGSGPSRPSSRRRRTGTSLRQWLTRMFGG